MSILVTGSVAFDHIMVFEGQFKNHILPDKIHVLNVSFLVPSLDRRWGGTAANIAYNLRILEEDPIVLATAGQDFGPYWKRFDECGIRTDGVQVLEDAMTAQAFITTDLDDNQITAFHPGAMERAHEAPIAALAKSYPATAADSTARAACAGLSPRPSSGAPITHTGPGTSPFRTRSRNSSSSGRPSKVLSVVTPARTPEISSVARPPPTYGIVRNGAAQRVRHAASSAQASTREISEVSSRTSTRTSSVR